MNSRRLRQIQVSAAILLFLLVAAAVVPAVRTPILRAAGSILVVDEALEPSDVIVVALDAGPAGVLEAADLFRAGIAPRVAFFVPFDEPPQREFVRRGILDEDDGSRMGRQLHLLGVTAAERIPEAVDGTE